MNDAMRRSIASGESVFTGSVLGLIGIDLATFFLSVLTLGIAYPWLLCWRQSWYAEHTYINGKQLDFNGTGLQLFGNWIKWILLTVVTLGIYGFWLPIKVEQWRVKHIHFAEPYRTVCDTKPASHTKPSIVAEEDKVTKYCTNCGAALNKGNTMFDGKHCHRCRPVFDSSQEKTDDIKPRSDITKNNRGFSKPSDSDLD